MAPPDAKKVAVLSSWVSGKKKWVDKHVTSLFPVPQLPVESQGSPENAYLQLNFLSVGHLDIMEWPLV